MLGFHYTAEVAGIVAEMGPWFRASMGAQAQDVQYGKSARQCPPACLTPCAGQAGVRDRVFRSVLCIGADGRNRVES